MNRKRWWYILMALFIVCMGFYVKKLVHIFPHIVQMYTGTVHEPMFKHVKR